MDRLLEFSQNLSELTQNFFPPLVLKEQSSSYLLGLYCLSTYNSIPNILEGENNLIAFQMSTEDPEKKKLLKLRFQREVTNLRNLELIS